MTISKNLSEAATTLHGIAADAGIASSNPPWPVEPEAQAAALAAMLADVAEGLAEQRAQAGEQPLAKLAAQVAALEPLALRATLGLDCGTPWPCAQPVDTLRGTLLVFERTRKEFVQRVAELNAECRNLEKRLTRAVVEEAAANTRAARAAYLHAEASVRTAAFDETIARAVARGHLPATIRDDLVEWSK